MNYIKIAENKIKEWAEKRFTEVYGETCPNCPEFSVDIPADYTHGDFALNIAFVSAKILKQPPKKIAEGLLAEQDFSGGYFKKVEVAGAGFINFYLSENFYADVLNNINEEKSDYGKIDFGKGKRILVEFVSANPTGPMHIGNARGGAIGDVLAALFEWAGYYVEREFYINDAGNQIEKFAKSLEARYLQINDPRVEMSDDMYQGQDIIDHAKQFYFEKGQYYLGKTSAERRIALVNFALPKNIETLEKDLKKYRIEFDTWFKESTLHKNNATKDVVKKLTELGYTYEKDGAVWFSAEKGVQNEETDFVLVRANGYPTYVVPDIAYHYDKLVTRKFDIAVNIWGADHHGYVPRLKSALKALGVDESKLEVILMQMVRVIRNENGEKKAVKLSKRSGKAITLATLLDEVPIDAARFFFNLREPNSQFEFDLDLAIEQSAQNPVFYVQYAHARICSLLNLLKNDGFTADYQHTNVLTSDTELELMRHLALLPAEIENAAKSYLPSKITRYALDTAALFHKFYDSCSIRNADTTEQKTARLALCESAKTVLANALSILKVTAPSKM